MTNKMEVKKLNLWYGKVQALYDVDMPVKQHKVTSIIGHQDVGNPL